MKISDAAGFMDQASTSPITELQRVWRMVRSWDLMKGKTFTSRRVGRGENGGLRDFIIHGLIRC